jgi:NAD(P) transhydrogenase subunit alpha
MIIAVPKESAAFETRVAITPDTAKKLIELGYTIHVQKSAGETAGFLDAMYENVGCHLLSEKDLYKNARIVCRVSPPSENEIKAIPNDALLIGMLKPHTFKPQFSSVAQKNITAFSMELLPRITRGQAMDVLSSQSNLAGYKAIVDAASSYGRGFPLMMTAAGTVPAAKVLVLGAGVAGLQAIATARRLGAIVHAYDVRSASKEQVESLGAKFVTVDYQETGDGSGGYAKEMSDGYKQAERAKLTDVVKASDIVITTAQIPGKPAPTLLTKEMVLAMRPGSVIVDLAVETGGNCELSEYGKVVQKNGITLIGHANMPSRIAFDASQLYARNLFNFIKGLFTISENGVTFDTEDELIKGTILIKDGHVVHPLFKENDAEPVKKTRAKKAQSSEDTPTEEAPEAEAVLSNEGENK